MKLKDEAKKIFLDIFGPEVARQIDSFEDSKKYPKDFLDECKFFMTKLMGEEVAEKKFQPLYQKYIETGEKNKGGE